MTVTTDDELASQRLANAELRARMTAASRVLELIARSPSDPQPVFDTIAESARELTGALYSGVTRLENGLVKVAALCGWQGEAVAAINRSYPRPAARDNPIAVAIIDGEVQNFADILTSGVNYTRELQAISGYRSMLVVPMMREQSAIGAISVFSREVNVFQHSHVDLLKTFANQAVIAIENARLFGEVQAKTRDLEESLQQQTATADVLKSISRATFDLQTVLDTLVESAARLCDASRAVLTRKRGDQFYRAALHGFPNEALAEMKNTPVDVQSGTIVARSLRDRAVVHVADVNAEPDYPGTPTQIFGGVRTVLSVPLLRENEPIGAFSVGRTRVEPFSKNHVELIKVFADQAVIAISNVELFEQVRQRTRELSQSLDDLRTAQDRLVQTQKLASLGQLTAGIAHEIKNPLNFVNNFSGMSAELIGELQDIVTGLTIDPDTHADIKELTGMLSANLEKIVQHGRRADAIVKSMLLHSGQSSGEHRLSDINALVDESLNRAYYGERAETRGFTIKLEKSFDPAVGEVDLFPREISRALLNLISNGFYATIKRKETEGGDYEPVLLAATRNLGDRVEIRIRDNGSGIPAEVKEKMFDPFFTTKPAGAGTGLGLSITHDIIVKQHGGSIEVDTKLGEFAEVRLILPRTGALLPERQ